MSALRERRRVAVAALAQLAPLFAALFAGEVIAQPRLVKAEGAGLVLTGLPAILRDDGVEPLLTSGLTAGMVIRVEGRRNELLGGARIEIRYELWDEHYLVSALGADGRVLAATLETMAALEAWWEAAEIPVVAGRTPPALTSVRIALEIVPFSRTEQDDTQRWFSETVHRGGISSDDRAKSADKGGDALEKVFSVLIATSIQRRPLESFFWEVDVPRDP